MVVATPPISPSLMLSPVIGLATIEMERQNGIIIVGSSAVGIEPDILCSVGVSLLQQQLQLIQSIARFQTLGLTLRFPTQKQVLQLTYMQYGNYTPKLL